MSEAEQTVDVPVQHVRKRASRNVFEAIERLDRLFEVRIGDPDMPLRVGDHLTFEEWDQGDYTGRRMTRRISYALNTSELNVPEDELQRRGLDIYGLVPPEYRRLRSVLGHSFVIAAVISKTGPDREWTVSDGPAFLPMLVCPAISIDSLLDWSNVNRWPIGLYSLHWMLDVRHADGPDGPDKSHVDIVDMLAWTWAEEGDDIQILELDVMALRNGDMMDSDGHAVRPVHPESLEEDETIDDDDGIPDDPVRGILDGTMEDDELARMMLDPDEPGEDDDDPDE